MSLDRLGDLITALRKRFALADGAEITLEANPRDLAEEQYRLLRGIGVNRLSIGVQSVDEGVLREMGRLHSVKDSYQAVSWARDAGFENISCDLILGWPGETTDRWENALRALRDLEPDHVSLYILELEGKTALSHHVKKGNTALPDEDLVATLYWATAEALDILGVHRYEISNFARPGYESRHNAKYWDDTDFLGFGQAAHSYRDSLRFWNDPVFATYCRRIEEQGIARVGERALSRDERMGEALFTGLRRREGVDLLAMRERYGAEPLAPFAASLEGAFAAGLIESEATRLRLTPKGVLLSNEVFQAFV
jgi:oxygen-independent coproporphyrinogen-3 oxidase